MNEPSSEQPDPRTVARLPRHLSGGEQTPDSPFDWPTPPVITGATQFSPLAVALAMDTQTKWTHS